MSIISLMCVTPLLVVAIGVDDAFLLLHSWQRLNEMSDSSRRMAMVLVEVGPSIMITSATNALAFAVGMLTPIPQIQKFCLCTALAIAIDFVLELTLFAPTLVLADRRSVETGPSSVRWPKVHTVFNSFLTAYSELMVNRKAWAIASVALLVSWCFNLYGISIKLQVHFDPTKTVPSDSAIMDMNPIISGIYAEHKSSLFIVSRPPALPNDTELNEFMQLVNELESSPDSLGPNFTTLWLRDYESWVRASAAFDIFGLPGSEETPLTYDDVPFFLKTPAAKPFAEAKVIKWHYTSSGVTADSFTFRTAYSHLGEWESRIHKTTELRNTLAKYPKFNVTYWDFNASLYDIYFIVKQVTFAATLVTMACMGFICLFFIPSLKSLSVAMATIFSICLNTLGFLIWWHTDLDPITMINIILSVGFSVDYTAHIVYHYQASPTDMKPELKLQRTFHAVAFPMVQAATSTLLCISLLGFHKTYGVLVFAKTVFLVVTCGLIHGLVVLPMFLAALSSCCIWESNNERNEAEKQEMIQNGPAHS